MATGTVKWFNNTKGYGFINTEDEPKEIFAHFSAIQSSGYKTLKRGQKVEFELNSSDKGLIANNIRPFGE